MMPAYLDQNPPRRSGRLRGVPVRRRRAQCISPRQNGRREEELPARRFLVRPTAIGSRSGSARPGRVARGADRDAVPELVPIRQGACWSRRSRSFGGPPCDGRRSRADPDRTAGSALRRRPPLEFRCVRRTRPATGLLDQRLRRDPAGAVRVGREAAGGELRGRRRDLGFEEPSAARRRDRVGSTARRWPASRRCGNIDVWYTRLDVDGMVERIPEPMSTEAEEAMQARPREGADEGQHACPREAVPRGRRRAADHRRPAARSPRSRMCCRGRAGAPRGDSSGNDHTYRRSLPARSTEAARGYRYVHAARKVVGVGSVGTRAWIVLMLGRDDQDPLFLQFKEAEPSVLEPYLGRASTPSTGSGSWRDSG